MGNLVIQIYIVVRLEDKYTIISKIEDFHGYPIIQSWKVMLEWVDQQFDSGLSCLKLKPFQAPFRKSLTICQLFFMHDNIKYLEKASVCVEYIENGNQ